MKRTAVLKAAPIFGLAGVTVIVLGMVIAGVVYQGRMGQAYRLANHFVSELGELGVSRASWAFNGGLVFGGFGILVFVIGLAGTMRSWIRFVLGALGIITGTFGALVGLFPMNNLEAHTFVANGFFYPGLLTMTLFSLYVLFSRHHELPRWVAIPGLVAAGSLFVFLFFSAKIDAAFAARVAAPAGASFGAGRPRIWVMALSEWVAIGAVLLWVAAVAGILIARSIRRDH